MEWARRNSPLNKLFFPGAWMNPTYDMDTFHDERLRLLWLPMDLTGKNQGVIPTAVATPVAAAQPVATAVATPIAATQPTEFHSFH